MPLTIDITQFGFYRKGYAIGYEEGFKNGREEGINEARADLATHMLKSGEFSIEKIAQHTLLNREEVIALREQI